MRRCAAVCECYRGTGAGASLRWRCLALLVAFAALLLGGFDPVLAEATLGNLLDHGVIELERVSLAEPLTIDGRLDEPVWSRLAVHEGYASVEPDTLVPAIHPTRLRLFYTERGLYVGFDLDQPADTILSRLSGRDAAFLNRDSIGFTLDTSGTGRYGFWFDLALGDSKSDGTVLPERNFTRDWDGPWRGGTALTERGWSAEFFVPWSALSMPGGGAVRRMGIYSSRKVAYLGERWGWPPLPPTQPYFMSALQQIQFSGVSPTQQYNIYPYVSVGRDAVDDVNRYRAGADLFWRPSTNFQLNAALNPDFGGVESDDVVINLNATEVFFPDKRLFFLEGQEVFNATPRADTRGRGVGNRGAPYTLINTRRIGGRPLETVTPPGVTVRESEFEQPVDLLGAVRSSGQFGGYRYGVLAAFESDVKIDGGGSLGDINLHQAGSDYLAARVIYENNAGGRYRALGLLSTAALNPLRDAITHGVDWHYYTEGSRLKIDGQLFVSDIDASPEVVIDDVFRDDQGIGVGGFLDFDYAVRTGVYQRLGIEYMDRQVNLNDFGFLERNDRFRIRSAHTRTRSDISWARENQFDARGFAQVNHDGDFTGGGLFLSNRTLLNSLAQLTLRMQFQPGQVDDINSFGNGSYRIEEKFGASFRWDSDNTRELAWGFGAGYSEEDLGGDSFRLEASTIWRPGSQATFEAGVTYRERDGWLLHQEDRNFTEFRARQWQPFLKGDVFLTARQQIGLLLQWVAVEAEEDQFYRVPDDVGSLLSVPKPPGPPDSFSVSQYSFQLRYRWEIAPLSDLFIVYTKLGDRAAALRDEDFRDFVREAWDDPDVDLLLLKLRYRLGS